MSTRTRGQGGAQGAVTGGTAAAVLLAALVLVSGPVEGRGAGAVAPRPKPSSARSAAKPAPLPAARDFIARAFANERVAYAGTRTSIFWSDKGASRAVVMRVYRDGDKARYEYHATGSMPEHVIIETETSVYFVGPGGKEVMVARRQHDPDVDGVRVDLALRNYTWRYETPAAPAPQRRVVAAYNKETGRLVRRFWVLLTRDVIVRAEHYDNNGRLRASWSISAEFEPHLDASLFAPPHNATAVVKEVELPERITLDAVEKRAGFRPLPIPGHALPRGFEHVDTFVEQSAEGKAVSLVYSDGLDSLTLLEALVPRGPHRKVATAHRVRILDRTAQVVSRPEASLVHWRDSQRLYTLMGSMSGADLVQISQELVRSARSSEPTVATPARSPAAPPQPQRRTWQDLLVRGWKRLLRWF